MHCYIAIIPCWHPRCEEASIYCMWLRLRDHWDGSVTPTLSRFSREVDLRFPPRANVPAASCLMSPCQNNAAAASYHFLAKRNTRDIYISSLRSSLVSLKTCGCSFIRPARARLPDADNIGGFSWAGCVFSINSLKPQPAACAPLFQNIRLSLSLKTEVENVTEFL